ncbi:hypothetical protein PCANC_05797 [Puccinia coronata f. sp. avenae]|uniref:Uncharacterized protein n=1 Tax=Puccinia coronata f. sp. avenae TaxID=200324 RepID=A0A2N5VSX7_9BASI|nr:hypothetical protein PCANC_11378 [Puccinia coronata f. sp. avenae]PLW53077.1 hypothetical protein PCANC_05797 [Puccinia coronata f. sp. avenae]
MPIIAIVTGEAARRSTSSRQSDRRDYPGHDLGRITRSRLLGRELHVILDPRPEKINTLLLQAQRTEQGIEPVGKASLTGGRVRAPSSGRRRTCVKFASRRAQSTMINQERLVLPKLFRWLRYLMCIVV